MDNQYSIEEILVAVNEFQENKKIKIQNPKPEKKYNSDIPKNTLKLIEEAEKGKN